MEGQNTRRKCLLIKETAIKIQICMYTISNAGPGNRRIHHYWHIALMNRESAAAIWRHYKQTVWAFLKPHHSESPRNWFAHVSAQQCFPPLDVMPQNTTRFTPKKAHRQTGIHTSRHTHTVHWHTHTHTRYVFSMHVHTVNSILILNKRSVIDQRYVFIMLEQALSLVSWTTNS